MSKVPNSSVSANSPPINGEVATNPSFNSLTALEKKTIVILSAISGLRMLGFFMLLPVFKNLANSLNHSSSALIGLAMGIYGLLQAALYLPLGVISDKFGRKPVIFFGLVLLCLGAIISANASDIYTLIGARALQGVGAISAVLTALMADTIRPQHQTKGLMAVGIMVGLSFPISLMVAPALFSSIGYAGFFNTLAVLAALALLASIFLPAGIKHPYYNANDFKEALKTVRQKLSGVMLGVFCLHALSMMFFYAAPTFFSQILKTPLASQWHIYVPILLISFLAISPLMRQRKPLKSAMENNPQLNNLPKPALKTSISQILFLAAYAFFMIGVWQISSGVQTSQLSTAFLYIALVLYFMAFNYLEVMQPSYIAKIAPKHLKGSVMGVYYMLQSLGMFAGALLAGILEKKISAALNINHFNRLAEAPMNQLSNYFILFFAFSIFFVVLWMLIGRVFLRNTTK